MAGTLSETTSIGGEVLVLRRLVAAFEAPLEIGLPVLLAALFGCDADQIATDPPPFWESRVEELEGEAINAAQWDSAHVVAWSEGRRIGEGFDFSMLRGAALLPDGRIALLEAQPPAVVLISPGGSVERVIGREGAGPGEFIYPQDLDFRAPDSLVVFDPGARRVTWLLTDGTVARIEILPDPTPPYGALSFLGVDAAGGVIGTRQEDVAFEIREGEAWRPRHRLVRLAGSPLEEVVVAEMPGLQREVRTMPAPGQPEGALVSAPRQGGPDTRVALGSPCVVLAYETGTAVLGVLRYKTALGIEDACTGDQRHAWVPTDPSVPVPDREEGEEWLYVGIITGSPAVKVRLPVGMTILAGNEQRVVAVSLNEFDVPVPMVFTVSQPSP